MEKEEKHIQRVCGSVLDFVEMQKTDLEQYKRFMDYEELLKNKLLQSRVIPSGTIIIPVVVHVVYFNSTQNNAISDAQIHAQIKVLNDDFRRLNADRVNTPSVWTGIAADTNFEFVLASIAPNGNATTGITRTLTTVNGFSQSLNNVKSSSAGGINNWNPQRYLNIWVCNLSPSNLMGYATFPQNLATNPNLDGVVVSFRYFGVGGHTSAPYNRGRTLTHEVGHWLDLRHIWGDSSSCAIDDGVADTPVQTAPTYDCPSFPRTDICSSVSPGIMFMNYMDYTDDACMNLFTNGQRTRMRALFDNVNGLRRNIIPPPASISGPTLVCSSGATFTIQNFPIGGATVLWTCSSNLIGGGTGGSTATFRAIESGNYGWIQATVNGVPLRYEVWVGAPVVVQIIGNDITTNDIERYEVLFPLLSRATQFRWRIDPDWGASLDSTTMPGVTIEFSRGGFYQLFATATNACGTSSEISISIYKA